ncbi:MAG: RIP metalloprotease RseP [Bacteroidia bacterium]|nr:RIP metalloprotease RseP [Bacteroidia bacterium]MCZ2141287.1 RIP metalloprotease RseP [Bacteroidia bacterium]
MQGLIMAAQLIAGISILVILHEFGHFWAARAFGIRVEKFYLFFDAWGKKLFSIKIGETEYGIGWLPLGGYVKIAGMIDESLDTKQMEKPAEEWEFRSKPAWQRLIVMIGGVVMNIVVGIIIFAAVKFSYGEENLINSSIKHGIIPNETAQIYGFEKGDKLLQVNGKEIYYFKDAFNSEMLLGKNPPVFTINRNGIDTTITFPADYLETLTKSTRGSLFIPRMEVFIKKVIPGSPAENAGLQADDKIIAINNTPALCFDEFQPMLKQHAGTAANLTVLRGVDTLALNVNVSSDSTIGFMPYDKSWTVDTIKYTIMQAIPAGVKETYTTIYSQIAGWGKIFNGDIAVNKALQGPIGIAKFYGPTWDWLNFWLMTALISLGLAFMNILPIPALDGGHVVLLLIEMLMGRPLSNKLMERIQTIGVVILLTLMVLIFGNDILSLFLK